MCKAGYTRHCGPDVRPCAHGQEWPVHGKETGIQSMTRPLGRFLAPHENETAILARIAAARHSIYAAPARILHMCLQHAQLASVTSV